MTPNLLAFTFCLAIGAPSAPSSAPAAPSGASAALINEHTRPDLFADQPPPRPGANLDEPPPLPETGIGFWASFVFRTVLVLGVVVLLAYLTLHKGLGKLMKNQGLSATRTIRLLERVPLGQKHALFLVEVEGRKLLVGTSDQSTSLVCDFGEKQRDSGQTAAEVLNARRVETT